MSAPISIMFKPPNHSDDFNEYQYNLRIYMKNGMSYNFTQTTNEKFCKLTDKHNDIIFHEIKTFTLVLTVNYFDKYVIHKDFILDEYDDMFSYKDDDLYIEFIKNGRSAVTNCYFRNQNTNKVIFTPPNY